MFISKLQMIYNNIYIKSYFVIKIFTFKTSTQYNTRTSFLLRTRKRKSSKRTMDRCQRITSHILKQPVKLNTPEGPTSNVIKTFVVTFVRNKSFNKTSDSSLSLLKELSGSFSSNSSKCRSFACIPNNLKILVN